MNTHATIELLGTVFSVWSVSYQMWQESMKLFLPRTVCISVKFSLTKWLLLYFHYLYCWEICCLYNNKFCWRVHNKNKPLSSLLAIVLRSLGSCEFYYFLISSHLYLHLMFLLEPVPVITDCFITNDRPSLYLFRTGCDVQQSVTGSIPFFQTKNKAQAESSVSSFHYLPYSYHSFLQDVAEIVKYF
jgi:hypothetical protein